MAGVNPGSAGFMTDMVVGSSDWLGRTTVPLISCFDSSEIIRKTVIYPGRVTTPIFRPDVAAIESHQLGIRIAGE